MGIDLILPYSNSIAALVSAENDHIIFPHKKPKVDWSGHAQIVLVFEVNGPKFLYPKSNHRLNFLLPTFLISTNYKKDWNNRLNDSYLQFKALICNNVRIRIFLL